MNESYHDTPEQSTKICSKCHMEKPLDAFYKESKRKDGRKGVCRICCDAYYRVYAHSEIPVHLLMQLPLVLETKICADCHIEKPLDAFGKTQRRCKQCQNARYRASDRGQQSMERQNTLIPKARGNRICRRCLIEKPLCEFSASSRDVEGYATQCKECISHQQYVVNRDRSLECMRNHYANNKEDYQATMRKWREENMERDRDAHRKWAQENPLRVREIHKRRKLRVKNAFVGRVDYDLVIEQYGFICHICNKEIAGFGDLHMEHVIPLARGGPHSQENLRPSHGVCNLRKHDKLMEELTDYDRRGPDA